MVPKITSADKSLHKRGAAVVSRDRIAAISCIMLSICITTQAAIEIIYCCSFRYTAVIYTVYIWTFRLRTGQLAPGPIALSSDFSFTIEQ